MSERLPRWVADYIRVSFREMGRDMSGADCWGLTRLVMQREYGVDLPIYNSEYDTTSTCTSHMLLLRSELDKENPDWREITPANAKAGDVAILACGAVECHVGVFVTASQVLHTGPRHGAVVQAVSDVHNGIRVSRVYRHRKFVYAEIC